LGAQLFETNFEQGGFDSFDNVAVSGHATYAAQRQVVHSGQVAARLTIQPYYMAASPGVRLVYFGKQATHSADRHNLPDEAYYSAWYFLPYVETPWINIMQWKQGRMTNPKRQARDPVAFVKLEGKQDRLALSLQHRVSKQGAYSPRANCLAECPDVPVPISEWFELTTLYRWDRGRNGRIATWLNGHMLWDVERIQTEYNQPFVSYPREVTWNNYAAAVKPNPYSLYLDDIRVWTA
jgi:hypothetical protein